jgi:hypothetical protein
MKGYMNSHIMLFICRHYVNLILNIIFNYIYIFGLIEGKNPSVAREQLQDSVNSTGVLFTYL